ncbi:MAG: hypothetical protein KIT80_04295 [Chitinophagaceae bacterium]|nr:hypothetical protein [Chitinophagaceae bacterium]MCW5926110.1 hypothetical protein [Chitinophagaceae bacterium]
MKNLILTAAILITGSAAKAQTDIQFVSQQHQQIKFDSTFNAYFIDNESSMISYIEVEKNTVSLGTGKSTARIGLSNDNLQAINKKESFTVNSQNENGAIVKLAFWFIDGELEEVSFTDANRVTTSYKGITVNTKDISHKKTIRPNNL